MAITKEDIEYLCELSYYIWVKVWENQDKTIQKKIRSETLTCGCCWDWFSTWEWYVDQDQDKWYWICKKCQKAEQKRTDKFYDDTFEMIYNKVNDDTRAKFDARIKQLGKKKFKIILVNMALDKGRIDRSIWGKK